MKKRGFESYRTVFESGMVGVYDLQGRIIVWRRMSFKSLGCQHWGLIMDEICLRTPETQTAPGVFCHVVSHCDCRSSASAVASFQAFSFNIVPSGEARMASGLRSSSCQLQSTPGKTLFRNFIGRRSENLLGDLITCQEISM